MERQPATNSEALSLPQLWYRPAPASLPTPPEGGYRPAALIECRLSFRSIRAGFQHTEERYYTAWYPARGLTIDWATPAVNIANPAHLVGLPPGQVPDSPGRYDFSRDHFAGLEEELVSYLTRTARFSVFHNANFALYSTPNESREGFLARVSEAARDRIEPDLKRLLSRFELAIEQLREVQSRRGRKLEGDEAEDFFTRWRNMFATSETHLADMFLGRGPTVLDTPELSAEGITDSDDRQLIEELRRVEKEAKTALNSLYTEYIQMIEQCDKFEVGLQRDNIHILQRALLWVPGAQTV